MSLVKTQSSQSRLRRASQHHSLPSLSSSVSSCSSGTSIHASPTHGAQSMRSATTSSPYYYYSAQLPMPSSPVASTPLTHSASVRAQPRQQTHLPQRSASAGSLARQQQWETSGARHDCHGYTRDHVETQCSHARQVSFNKRVVVIPSTGQCPDVAFPKDGPLDEPTPSPTTPNATATPSHLWWDESQLALELAEDDLIDEDAKHPRPARRLRQKISSIMQPAVSYQSIPASPKSSRFARPFKKLSHWLL